MEILKCPNCGGNKLTNISPTEKKCQYCGHIIKETKSEPQTAPQPTPQQFVQPPQNIIINNGSKGLSDGDTAKAAGAGCLGAAAGTILGPIIGGIISILVILGMINACLSSVGSAFSGS